MTYRTLFRIGIVLATMTSITGLTSVAAAADDTETYTHCVVQVVGQEDDGEFILGDETCFSDFADAMASIGLGKHIDTPQKAVSAALSVQSVIGVHYDGASFTGDSFSISGADCGGGYVNMTVAWDNRVSSTIGGCPRIRHWTGANKTGSSQDTVPHGNLSSPVNNAVSSIQYLT